MGEECIIIVLFIANAVFVLCGLALIISIKVILTKLDALLEYMEMNIKTTFLEVAIAIAVSGIAILGFFVAQQKMCSLLCPYYVAMGALAIMTSGMLYYVFHITKSVPIDVEKKIYKEFIGITYRQLNDFHVVEKVFRCCGSDNSYSYFLSKFSGLPDSCCTEDDRPCTHENAYVGCAHVVPKKTADMGLSFKVILGIMIGCEITMCLSAYMLTSIVCDEMSMPPPSKPTPQRIIVEPPATVIPPKSKVTTIAAKTPPRTPPSPRTPPKGLKR